MGARARSPEPDWLLPAVGAQEKDGQTAAGSEAVLVPGACAPPADPPAGPSDSVGHTWVPPGSKPTVSCLQGVPEAGLLQECWGRGPIPRATLHPPANPKTP